jgi:hypothetical protein
MDAYFHFLVIVFDVTNKVQLCLIAVKNQDINLFGGEANFNPYLADNDGMFIPATNDKKKYITCSHTEAILNPKYCNANTPGYAIICDESYTLIHFFFDNSDSCQEAANIINAAGGTQSFELMKLAAWEKSKRHSERLLGLSAKGKHPWQQPKFIERNRKLLLDLGAKVENKFQQPGFIQQHRVRHIDLGAKGQHNFQCPEVIERNREWKVKNMSRIVKDQVAKGEHNFVTDHPAKKRLLKIFNESE